MVNVASNSPHIAPLGPLPARDQVQRFLLSGRPMPSVPVSLDLARSAAFNQQILLGGDPARVARRQKAWPPRARPKLAIAVRRGPKVTTQAPAPPPPNIPLQRQEVQTGFGSVKLDLSWEASPLDRATQAAKAALMRNLGRGSSIPDYSIDTPEGRAVFLLETTLSKQGLRGVMHRTDQELDVICERIGRAALDPSSVSSTMVSQRGHEMHTSTR